MLLTWSPCYILNAPWRAVTAGLPPLDRARPSHCCVLKIQNAVGVAQATCLHTARGLGFRDIGLTGSCVLGGAGAAAVGQPSSREVS